MPSSTRPPDIWSTWATEMASGPGSRNVAAVTSVPSRIVVRLAGDAGQRDPGVGRTGQAVGVAHLEVVVAAEERSEAEAFGALCDGQQIVVRGALLRFGEDADVAEFHASDPSDRVPPSIQPPRPGERSGCER